jgi:hypothetical protein
MNSLAALAHTTHTAVPAFNTAFYSTVATIIPVLFLAIAIQGRTYEDLTKAYATANRKLWHAPSGSWRRRFASATILITTGLISAGIVALGAIGEIRAIFALYQQHADRGTQQVVFVTVTFLIVVVAGAPLLATGRALRAESREPGGGESPGEKPQDISPPERSSSG